MNTHITTELLNDYLHRELAPQQDASLLAHLHECAACTQAYEEQARLSEALKAYARMSERELPQGVVNRIWDQIERENTRPSFAQRLAALWRPAVAVPAAAVIVVGAFFGYAALHQSAPVTTIDASYYLQDHAALTGTVPFSEGSIVPAGLRSGATTADSAPAPVAGAMIVPLR